MRIAAIAAHVVRWPIAGTGAARGRSERAAVLLEVRSDRGTIGLGEAAPLPGMSSDTLAQAEAAIAELARLAPFELAVRREADAVRDEPAVFDFADRDVARIAIASPAARFAIETALCDAIARDRGISLAGLLAAHTVSRSLRAAAVVDDPDAARAAWASGIRCVKIKLAADDSPERAFAIAAVVPGARLRIDANRSWPRAEVAARLAALAALPIDYVEEPCRDAHELLAAPLPCRIALDESLVELTPDALAAALASPQLAAIILKPTLLGGLSATLALAERARRAGVAAIVSHALEGPIGTAACAELALALGGDVPVGLAPHAALAAWSIEVPQLAADCIRPVATPPAERGRSVAAPGLGFAALDLAGAVRACGSPAPPGAAGDPLSILDAARDAPHRVAIETASQSLSFAACAASAPRAAGDSPMVVVATPSLDTVLAVHAALAARRPIALLHHRLAAGEAERQRALIEHTALPPETAAVLFTSGSTGAARGVVLSRSALVAAAEASARHLGWRDDDRWLLALSLAHAGGLSIVVRCLAARRPIVLCDRDFDRAAVAALLDRCTLASLVPAQLDGLLDDPAWRPPPRLRAVLLGGAAASPALLERAAARGVPFLTTYGMTESLGQLATAPPERAGDPHAPLVPLPGVALDAGTAVAPAPIVVRAAMLATCYLDGAPIAPAFTTADLGHVEAGVLHVAGRRDDVIITGGENVHPAMVEAALAATPGVRAACAFGVRDERWGEIVAAALVVDPAFDPAAAAAHWRAALPGHARPRRIAICAALPLLPSGKVDRRAAAALPASAIVYRS